MSIKQLQLLQPPPASRLFYLECTEKSTGQIKELRRFFNERLNAAGTEPEKKTDIILLEIFTAQRRWMRKNLLGIRILFDRFTMEADQELSTLLKALSLDVESRIMGVTRGQYAAEIRTNYNLEATTGTFDRQLKSLPDIEGSSSHQFEVDRFDTRRGTASLTAHGDPKTIAAIYAIMNKNFRHLSSNTSKFKYTHALAFST